MADEKTLIELADRCESAPQPSVDLDWDITTAVFFGDRDMMQSAADSRFSPTHSLTAAAMLIPAGYEWTAGREEGTAFAHVHVPNGWDGLVEAATPALALCAASLRAAAVVAKSNEAKAA